MANCKRVSDEAVVAALVTHGSVKAAAEACGLAARTIYDRLDRQDFCGLYQNAKLDVVRTAVLGLNSKLAVAVDTLAEVASDRDANAAIRIQAASALLKNAAGFNAVLTQLEADTREINNPLNMWI